MQKEAKARIKINALLQEASWRFFDDANGRANIILENYTKITQKDIDAFGSDFEKTKKGFLDFLLLDPKGFPYAVLEAKSEDKSPLDGKEQARKYAQSQNVRFILLSNGNVHYFWDLTRGNPTIITAFPTPDSLATFQWYTPNPKKLVDKYQKLFSPTDFDLIISDEAHRSIGGNSRAVFEYFIGYKLGLTATPKDYLKRIDAGQLNERDPREWERRQLLDTYKTFGCESGTPTFRYSLIDGVTDGYLVNPIVADARTEITTELLSDKGYSLMVETEEGIEEPQTFFQRDLRRSFFPSRPTACFARRLSKTRCVIP